MLRTDRGALTAERARLRCTRILYVGDDENDEDAFALSGNIVPVRIGKQQKSQARFYLRKQGEIDELIELLVMSKVGSDAIPIRPVGDRANRIAGLVAGKTAMHE